ncbi:MAG TPA: 3-oxoacyl-ACP reductase family protein [Candidatus Tectomicrobia bacterium]|jgi:meso-butanediol dehydrogenase/(S,S)-butanediol dehydrogenase/diacetyl reductase|nr:3-oxoacyl-ACP reductase family protein [Candidatus Tectomicrobia bacterium]
MTRFVDKVVLITGAGRGIGRAMALRFAREGANIVAADIEPALAESTAAAVNELGRQCLPLTADVRQQGDIQRLVAQAVEQFRRIDVLCNNAGVLRFQDMFDITEADWDFVNDVNTKGVFFVMQAVAREMVKRRSGKIVNTASISGKQPEPQFLHYGVSKAGVIHMTKSAAVVLAPYNINVNAVCPGTTVTDMSLMATAGRAKIMGVSVEEAIKAREAQIPIGRRNQPDDIAAMAAFLASPDADQITGQAFNVDGGLVMY